MMRIGLITLVLSLVACAASSRQGLPLLHRAVEANTVRVLIENLSAEDAVKVDPQKVCDDSLKAQDMWFDALRLLDMQQALRSYSRCGSGVRLDLFEATKLPLTATRKQQIAKYVENWKEVSVKQEIGEPLKSADYATMDVLFALEASGTPEALQLCERLAAKVTYRCRVGLLTGERIFDSPENAVANDPFLMLYKPRHVATSHDGVRRFYILDTLRRPHDDTCRPVAVLASAVNGWSLERVECETTSELDAAVRR
jgi:hypothetical protein